MIACHNHFWGALLACLGAPWGVLASVGRALLLHSSWEVAEGQAELLGLLAAFVCPDFCGLTSQNVLTARIVM